MEKTKEEIKEEIEKEIKDSVDDFIGTIKKEPCCEYFSDKIGNVKKFIKMLCIKGTWMLVGQFIGVLRQEKKEMSY